MWLVLRNVMAGRERKYTPRARTQRPLGSSMTTNTPPAQSLPEPRKHDEGWFLPAPLAQRLYEKSALGVLSEGGGIVLTPEELMFCHWYRHVPLPRHDATWFGRELKHRSELALRCIAMDVLRNGGELVVPRVNLLTRFPTLPSVTWAVRWERHETWTKHHGFSQIRVHHAQESLDWDELHGWVNEVVSFGHRAELCVVDDEFDATVYELCFENPSGDQTTLSSLSSEQRSLVKDICTEAIPIEGGFFVENDDEWPLSAIGLSHFSGRFLRQEEHDHLLGNQHSPHAELYSALVNRGLLLRPGFKYGCRWRVYETDMMAEHAPWLVQPRVEAPRNWEEVCLSVRLAEGVNKRWLCAMRFEETFSFLNIKRQA